MTSISDTDTSVLASSKTFDCFLQWICLRLGGGDHLQSINITRLNMSQDPLGGWKFTVSRVLICKMCGGRVDAVMGDFYLKGSMTYLLIDDHDPLEYKNAITFGRWISGDLNVLDEWMGRILKSVGKSGRVGGDTS